MEKKINGGSNWLIHAYMEIGHKNCVCVCVCLSRHTTEGKAQ